MLTISLFVAGYTFGPLVWGPASEQIGRKPVFLVAFLFYTGFQVSFLHEMGQFSSTDLSCLSGWMCPLAQHGRNIDIPPFVRDIRVGAFDEQVRKR